MTRWARMGGTSSAFRTRWRRSRSRLLASAATFAVGAVLPLVMVLLIPAPALMWGLAGSSLVFLALLGVLSARAGGAPVLASALRVTFWGALAMALTAGVGALFGVAA